MIIQRRKFITGLLSLIASPALVKASSLMPINVIDWNITSVPIRLDYTFNLYKRDAVKWIMLNSQYGKFGKSNWLI